MALTQEQRDNIAKPPSGWKSMHSAPRNGTYILVFLPPDKMMVVFWCSKKKAWCIDEGGWGDVRFGNDDPTHWCKLPGPPTE